MISIFQSYSHLDWLPASSKLQGSRLSEFIGALQKNLRTSSSRSDFRWLRDQDWLINNGDNIDGKVEEAVAACDIAVVALSPAYVESGNTTTEFDLLMASGKPVFVIGLEPVDEILLARKNWRGRMAAIQQSLVCQLYVDDAQRPGRPHLLGYPIPTMDLDHVQTFYDRARHLAEDIRQRGYQLLSEAKAPAAPGADGQADGWADDGQAGGCDVLILAPSPDAVPFAEQLTEMLDARDLAVSKLTIEGLTRAALERALAGAKIVAQIFGAMDGRKIEGVAATRFQFHSAREAGKPPSVWLTPHARNTEDLHSDYRDFVLGVEHDNRALDEFAGSVINKLRQFDEGQRIARELGVPDSDPYVVIDSHPEDIRFGRIIQERLAGDCEDGPVVSFVQEGHDGFVQTQKLLRASLIHAVLLLYGPSDAGRRQLNDRLPDYRKSAIAGSARLRERRRAVAVGDPSLPDALPCPRGGGIYTLTLQGDQLAPEEAKRFIDHIRRLAGCGTPQIPAG